MTIIKIKRLQNAWDLPLPEYATPSSAGMDLRAAIGDGIAIIKPGKFALISSGIAIELLEGFEAQVRPRSGLAIKHGITVLNAPGTVDSDYRGEIKVCLINLGDHDFAIKHGDRIAQMVISRFEAIVWRVVDSLSDTNRDDGGFGSTGMR